VHVDPAQIDQVLVNLAVNARDAMPAGGALFLETEDVEPATPDGPGDVLLTVRDTGQGMDDSVRSQVFEPFFTTKAASGGTGLGLSMVYGIVQQSGGHIEVDSSPGSGSSFRIRLPGARERRVEASEPRAALPPSGKGETILVVEDEAVIRALACEMLETQGYRALEVASAEEALSLAERHAGPVDLLVTDVVMPGLGGPALAERFCALRPGTRVLFISGWAGDDLARRGFSEDRAPILPKPFTAEQLSQTVRAALDR
jgi:two-component system cell cycle sensor histidine kinase/response regulator CckA